MTTISFDTLAYAKKLIAVGYTPLQAEVLSEALKEIFDYKLANKQHLIDCERTSKHELRDMEFRLILIVGSIFAASIAIIAALIKFVH